MSSIFAGFSSGDNEAILATDSALYNGRIQRSGFQKVFPVGPKMLVAGVGDYEVLLWVISTLRKYQLYSHREAAKKIVKLLEPTRGQQRLDIYILTVEDGRFVFSHLTGYQKKPYDPSKCKVGDVRGISLDGVSAIPYCCEIVEELPEGEVFWSIAPPPIWLSEWLETEKERQPLRNLVKPVIQSIAEEAKGRFHDDNCIAWILPRVGQAYRMEG